MDQLLLQRCQKKRIEYVCDISKEFIAKLLVIWERLAINISYAISVDFQTECNEDIEIRIS